MAEFWVDLQAQALKDMDHQEDTLQAHITLNHMSIMIQDLKDMDQVDMITIHKQLDILSAVVIHQEVDTLKTVVSMDQSEVILDTMISVQDMEVILVQALMLDTLKEDLISDLMQVKILSEAVMIIMLSQLDMEVHSIKDTLKVDLILEQVTEVSVDHSVEVTHQ